MKGTDDPRGGPLPKAERPAADFSDLLLVIPVHNERASIGQVVAEARRHAPGARVLVVDDGSEDGSAEVAGRAGAQVVSLPINLGYGAAVQTGFLYAARRNYNRVVQLDGDGQHDPAFVPVLLEALEGADVVVGSRFLGRAAYAIPWPRRLGMRLFSQVASWATRSRITDASSGFQALERGVVRFFAQGHYPTDFPDADTIILLHRAGFRVREVGVVMRERRVGSSMIGNARSLYYVFKMILSILVTLLRVAPRPREEDGS